MCDTLVALNNTTADGSVIFAKNSDREPNEAQEIVLVPAADHPTGSRVQCTYLDIPQAPHTNRVLLSKPYWMWGAEMGANEHNVVIGNEALFTRVAHKRQPALTGMDLLRLALERAQSAQEAVDCIIQLLETYGQGGSGSPSHEFLYHNSFLVADKTSAWRLETAGSHWAAQQVSEFGSISNVITIGSEWDRASTHLVDEAVKRGWVSSSSDFHFDKAYSDHFYTPISNARHRCSRSRTLLEEGRGKISVQGAFQVLRDHGNPEHPERYTPARGFIGAEVCMHLGAGPVRTAVGQTTCSMVAHLTPQGMTLWLTGTAAPCTSTFKPIWLEAGLPELGHAPTAKFDPAALWWQHEQLHREVMKDYAHRLPIYKAERDALELGFSQKAGEITDQALSERFQFSQECFSASRDCTERWIAAVRNAPLQKPAPWYFRSTWKSLNRKVGLPD